MNDYYVYIYLDQRYIGEWYYKNHNFCYRPFYIGKGKNNREDSHLWLCSLQQHSLKNSIIKAIGRDIGEVPIHYRLYDNLTEETAHKIEQELILYFGRKDNKTGILANHTDGGEGRSGKTRKRPEKRKRVYQYTLSGHFVKEWNGMYKIDKQLNLKSSMVRAAIKRNGTAFGFYWSDKYLGDKIKSRIKSQMPIKYTKVEQLETETEIIVKTFESISEVIKTLKYPNASTGHIVKASRTGKVHKGYKWKVYE